MNANIEFSARFRQALKESDLPQTQVELGKYFGLSGTMIWFYLNGEKLPSMKNAIAIARRLGVCVEWLLTGRGPKYPNPPPGEPELPINILNTLSKQDQELIRRLQLTVQKTAIELRERKGD